MLNILFTILGLIFACIAIGFGVKTSWVNVLTKTVEVPAEKVFECLAENMDVIQYKHNPSLYVEKYISCITLKHVLASLSLSYQKKD